MFGIQYMTKVAPHISGESDILLVGSIKENSFHLVAYLTYVQKGIPGTMKT